VETVGVKRLWSSRASTGAKARGTVDGEGGLGPCRILCLRETGEKSTSEGLRRREGGGRHIYESLLGFNPGSRRRGREPVTASKVRTEQVKKRGGGGFKRYIKKNVRKGGYIEESMQSANQGRKTRKRLDNIEHPGRHSIFRNKGLSCPEDRPEEGEKGE